MRGLPPLPDLLDLQRRAAAGGGAGEQAGHAYPLAVVETPQVAGQIVRRAVAVAHRRAGAVKVERAVHADRLGGAAVVAVLVIRGLVVVLAAVRIVLGRRRLALPVRTVLAVRLVLERRRLARAVRSVPIVRGVLRRLARAVLIVRRSVLPVGPVGRRIPVTVAIASVPVRTAAILLHIGVAVGVPSAAVVAALEEAHEVAVPPGVEIGRAMAAAVPHRPHAQHLQRRPVVAAVAPAHRALAHRDVVPRTQAVRAAREIERPALVVAEGQAAPAVRGDEAVDRALRTVFPRGGGRIPRPVVLRGRYPGQHQRRQQDRPAGLREDSFHRGAHAGYSWFLKRAVLPTPRRSFNTRAVP